MAIDYSGARMTNTSGELPGDTEYPYKYTEFVRLNGLLANEVEAARENETSLLLNLQNNYLTSTLANNITGNGFKFTGMPNGTSGSSSTDYGTVAQITAMGTSGTLPEVDELDNTTTGFHDVFHAEFNVDVAGDSGTFRAFEYNPSSLSGYPIKWPAALNKTYT